MSQISVNYKLFTVTTKADNGWTLIADVSSIGGIPHYLRVFTHADARIYGPAHVVTIAGQPVAYRYPRSDGHSEVMVII